MPTFPTLRGEYFVVHLEFESVFDVEFVDSVVDFHVSSWGKMTYQAWSSTCTKRAPPPRQVWVRRERTLRQRTGSSESSPSFRNSHLFNMFHGATKVKISIILTLDFWCNIQLIQVGKTHPMTCVVETLSPHSCLTHCLHLWKYHQWKGSR